MRISDGSSDVCSSDLRTGILGSHWADAAIPLAVAVGLPVTVSGYDSWALAARGRGTTGLTVIPIRAGTGPRSVKESLKKSTVIARRQRACLELVEGRRSNPVELHTNIAAGSPQPICLAMTNLFSGFLIL